MYMDNNRKLTVLRERTQVGRKKAQQGNNRNSNEKCNECFVISFHILQQADYLGSNIQSKQNKITVHKTRLIIYTMLIFAFGKSHHPCPQQPNLT